MLFSQKRVGDFINHSFEAVWESVRPVPIVRIDFGNGKVLTRTLHGNILTSICTPDGLVVDALPGIYQEAEYVAQLGWLRDIARNAQNAPAAQRDVLVRAYHRGRVEGLKRGVTQQHLALTRIIAPITKGRIETPIELALLPSSTAPVPVAKPKLEAKPTEDVARWKELAEDTRLNERTRRLQIHEMLARAGLVRPEKVTHPLYKEVLHADLDDPYLGLGEVLFARYPFAKEDASH